MAEPIVLRSPADVARLRARTRVALIPRPPLELELPTMTPAEQALWRARLGPPWSACGCREGELAVAVALPTWVGALLLGFAPSFATGTWVRVVIGVIAVMVMASLVGKLAGLLRAQWMLDARLSRLEARLRPSGPAIARSATSPC